MADLFGSGATPEKCIVIAEVAQAHDGSLGFAHAFIDAAANAGVDAVKFQTHIAHAESTVHEPWRVRFSPQDSTRFDYWRRMEFSEEQWSGLKQHADDKGIFFLSSPFSIEAYELLSRVGVAAWKIASGEITSLDLIGKASRSGLPVILSTGMATLAEIDSAVEVVRDAGAPLSVMQCTTAYPCPPDKVGLNLIPALADRYECPVGLSDHSGTIFPSLAAVILGAKLVEVHITLSREMFGPDVSSSLTTNELAQLVRGIRFTEQMLNNPVDKEALAREAEPLRRTFSKSVVTRTGLPAGTVLQADHLAVKKPGSGIPASSIGALIGATLARAVPADHLLSFDDLVGVLNEPS